MTALTISDAFSLKDLDSFITKVNKIPLLTPEEEYSLALRLQTQNDLDAASRLIMSHLRLVVKLSRQYVGYGLLQEDLIQEGNIGLMKAVKNFDPTKGFRLASYAIHFIRAEINEFIVKNWRIVKLATTKSQRKLFFNLRSKRNALKSIGNETYRDSLTKDEVKLLADELNVKPEEIKEMEIRMSGGDVALGSDDDEDNFAPIQFLTDDRFEPSKMFEAAQYDRLCTEGIQHALSLLDERSKKIIEERWLNLNDEGSGRMTLQELAKEFGVSAERIRQLEVAAFKKMRKILEESKL